MSEPNTALSTARSTLMNALFGTIVTQAVGLAARMELADAIGTGERHVDDLAARYDIPADRLNRLLRALACMRLCDEPRPGVFRLTEAGALLRGDHPHSRLALAKLLTDRAMQDAWLHLETSVRTGRTAFDEVFGMPVFEYLARNPELSTTFNLAMSQRTKGDGVTDTLPDHYDFSRFTAVTDVGGGDGTLLTAVLRRHTALEGTVFDTAEGVAQATLTLDAADLGGRCKVVAGDFFESVPGGSDLQMIKSVLHNWDDDRAVEILRHCREVLPDHGRLLIIEPILPERVNPEDESLEDPYLSDLNMMLLIGGRERTLADFTALCERAGLSVTDVVELPRHVDFGVIEAKPA